MGGTLVYRNQIAVDHRYADAGKWEPKSLPPAPDEAALDVGPDDQLQVDQMKLLWSAIAGWCSRARSKVTWRSTTAAHIGEVRSSDGTLACGHVQCPWHGSQFDVHDGSVKHGPAESPIGTYEVETKAGRVLLKV